MSIENDDKLKRLMQFSPAGLVMTSKWLRKKGYSHHLLKKYRDGGWLEAVGTGAMKRKNEKVSFFGGIHAIQKQLNKPVYIGGKTALVLNGYGHYLELGQTTLTLFGRNGVKLPKWFLKYDWNTKIFYYTTNFLPEREGIAVYSGDNLKVNISGAERAILECLWLVPQDQTLEECYQFMLALNGLQPGRIQQLLEKCNSVKTKRLFLYLADKVNHSWFKHLDRSKIDLGEGDRSIYKNGLYISKYKITVPAELEENDISDL